MLLAKSWGAVAPPAPPGITPLCLANGTYPNGLSKMEKSVLRRRVKFFRISGHELYYVGGGKSLATSFHS